MVRKYVRKSTRRSWDERKMIEAMNAILTKKMGYMKCSKIYGIPRTTLRTIIKRLEANGEVDIKVPLGTTASVFTREEESYLAAHLNSMDSRLFTVTIPIKRKLAYQLATKMHKNHKWKDEVAGREWLREFIKRQNLNSQSIGRPVTKTKLACFNKEAVNKFYEVLGEFYLKGNYTADRIYNCDETSISCDAKYQSSLVMNESGKGVMPSNTAGHTITVEVCMSATGLFMPLLFVFPRKTLELELTSNLILPCYTQGNETGWMNSDIFAWWLKHFVKFSRASKEDPVLLLMDGDPSHTTSLELLEFAESNGVTMLCLPEYCTHRIGPLEAEFFGNLSKRYVDAMKEWSNSHGGKMPSIREIPVLFEQAFIESATLASAVLAFRKTGIWPFRPNTFSENDFSRIGTSLLPHQILMTQQQSNQNGVNNSLNVAQVSENSKETIPSTIPESSWKPANNSTAHDGRIEVPSNCAENMTGNHMQTSRKRIYPEPQPMPMQNYQTNNYQETPIPGPSWKQTAMNPVNEMRFPAASAYVEAVLSGPESHPARSMHQHSEVPGCSNDPSMYNMVPHMYL